MTNRHKQQCQLLICRKNCY